MRLKAILLFIIALLAIQNANAQLEKHQAMFIYNFTKLIHWPGLENQLVFRIGVIGKNEPITAALLADMENRNVAGKPIEIVEFETLDNLVACHILFVPNNRMSYLRRAARTLLGVSVLIVTEAQEFMPAESGINIYVDNERMVYKLNQKRTDEARLVLSRQIISNSR